MIADELTFELKHELRDFMSFTAAQELLSQFDCDCAWFTAMALCDPHSLFSSKMVVFDAETPPRTHMWNVMDFMLMHEKNLNGYFNAKHEPDFKRVLDVYLRLRPLAFAEIILQGGAIVKILTGQSIFYFMAFFCGSVI